ncbi:TPA: ATP-dependent DNA helicase RecG [Vibrio parahaemolyticus]|nr:ATP-dependent DNA helicase RecG [Vibrio parahaemolyticus]
MELQESLALKDAEHFRKHYLIAAIDKSLIEMTIPEKPKSRLQKYRLTTLGHQVKLQLKQQEKQQLSDKKKS